MWCNGSTQVLGTWGAVRVRHILLKSFQEERMDKKISVIIPAYNAERTIQRTLASLISNKDYIYDIQVIDDHSSDNTVEKAKEFYDILPQLSIWTSDGYHNPGLARKTGLLLSSGDFVTFVDSDDCITPTSLYYVLNELEDDTLLLHSKTMYFESGNFVAENVGYMDNSCGGNFYRRDYLIDNSLFPHNELTLSEDEYFNDIIDKQIKLDGFEQCVNHFDYPVYQVYHDIDFGQSHAIRNWADYCIKSHLLYKEYVAEKFKDTAVRDLIIKEYCNNFIFAYFMFQALLLDKDLDNVEVRNQLIYFKRAILYFERNFYERDYLISFFFGRADQCESLWQSAIDCT